jgi:hypothetical protein
MTMDSNAGRGSGPLSPGRSPEPGRDTFLVRSSADDPSLVADAKALLAEDAREDFILDRGVDAVAASMLDRGDDASPANVGRSARCLGRGLVVVLLRPGVRESAGSTGGSGAAAP